MSTPSESTLASVPSDDLSAASEPPEVEVVETAWSELDLRSLALARVAMGLFVLLTVLGLWGDVTAFFTDQGVLSRQSLVNSPFRDVWLSFHMGTGKLYTQVALNSLLGAFAVGLMLGWRTPFMVVGCWVLLNSLQARNPFIFDRGDLELVLMLFWGFFLPLGGCWSLDARAGRQPFGRPTGMAAVAMVTQFAMIYLFAAYLKGGPFWLGQGVGLEYSLISPLFATDFSLWLAEAAGPLLRPLNYAVIVGELFAAMLLLSPFSVGLARSVAVGMLVLFHLLLGLTFQLGLFPWLGALLPLALLPAEAWQTRLGSRLADVLDRRLGSRSCQEGLHPGSRGDLFRSLFLAVALGLALLSNLLSTPAMAGRSLPGALQSATEGLRLAQHWDLFSPIPPYDGHFVLSAGQGGEAAKPVFEGPPTRESRGLQTFPGHRWRMLMIASLYPEFDLVREGLVAQLLRRAGLDLKEARSVDYRFEVRRPDDTGKWGEPESWSLWRKTSSDAN